MLKSLILLDQVTPLLITLTTQYNIFDIICWLSSVIYNHMLIPLIKAILPLCEFLYYKTSIYNTFYSININQTVNFFSNHSTYLYKINHYANYPNYTQFEILKTFKTYTMSPQDRIAWIMRKGSLDNNLTIKSMYINPKIYNFSHIINNFHIQNSVLELCNTPNYYSKLFKETCNSSKTVTFDLASNTTRPVAKWLRNSTGLEIITIIPAWWPFDDDFFLPRRYNYIKYPSLTKWFN